MTNELTPEKSFRVRLKARETLFWVVSDEERRVERAIATVAANCGYAPRFWDCATGAVDLDGGTVDIGKSHGNPKAVFAAIRNRTQREVWILRDLHHWLKDPTCERGLKTLAREVQEGSDKTKLAAIVVLCAESAIPPALAGSTTVIKWPLPNRRELRLILEDIVTQAGMEVNGREEAVIDAAAGLPAKDVETAIAFSHVLTGKVVPEIVADQKELAISRTNTLSWVKPDPLGLDSVGGYRRLKAWLEQRRLALSPEARAYGLPAPKGVLLTGVPGCGKSHIAKALPTSWGIPLLRIDLGTLKSKYVGQSEGNLAMALRTAEAVAPCILWVDEIDKGLRETGGSDGGVSSNALATVLTWLQDRVGTVFVVATANDVTVLPPELTRKGRFDEIWFFDLPTLEERPAILTATLRKYGRDPEGLDVQLVADLTPRFSGAELAELVPTAMFTAFDDGQRALATEDLLSAALVTIPIAESSKDKIDALRAWATNRARPASDPESIKPNNAGGRVQALEVDNEEH